MAQDPPSTPFDIAASRRAHVGNVEVRRALPQRRRRTVGPWCFADHFGPADVDESNGLNVGPHPHAGLHTVTWLLDGAALHRDSLGSEQVIRPGQVNLMSAGAGVTHSEEATGHYRGILQGIQLWVAQPDVTRDGASAFQHADDLPVEEIGDGSLTVFLGTHGELTSPASVEGELVGAEVVLAGTGCLETRVDFEHAVIPLEGDLQIEGQSLGPGEIAFLAPGRHQVDVRSDRVGRAVLLGGPPWTEPLLMWWNFVARTREEIAGLADAWSTRDDRFGRLTSQLVRADAPVIPWTTAT